MKKQRFSRKKLENGMTVLFEERKGTRIVSIIFGVRYGGINEKAEEKGISHFIEHLLYKGTKKRTAKEISEAIEKNGGILNGFTEEEILGFWCKLPAEKLNLGLDVLSDMIKNPLFDQKEIDKERQVIFEEMKIYKDNPRLYVFDKIKELMYKGDFAIPLIGTEKSMNSNNKERIVKKFKEVFNTHNMILCVVGDANFKDLCDFCEKNFSASGKKSVAPQVEVENQAKMEYRKGVEQANLVFGYHVPKAGEKDMYAAIVLNALMADGMSSRLWQEIREKRNLAYAVKGSCNPSKSFGYSTIYAGCLAKNVEKVKKLILEEFEKLVKELDEKELEAVKTQLIGNNRISKEDSQTQMIELLLFESYGKAEESYEYEKRIKEVKLKDVKKLAKIKNYSFFALIPEDSKK